MIITSLIKNLKSIEGKHLSGIHLRSNFMVFIQSKPPLVDIGEIDKTY